MTAEEKGVAAVARFLEHAGVEHEVLEHEPTYSATEEAQATGEEPRHTAKTLLLHDHAGWRLAVLPATHRLYLHKARRLLGGPPRPPRRAPPRPAPPPSPRPRQGPPPFGWHPPPAPGHRAGDRGPVPGVRRWDAAARRGAAATPRGRRRPAALPRARRVPGRRPPPRRA